MQETIRRSDPVPEPIPDPTPLPDPIPTPITPALAEPGPRTVAFLIDGGILLAADIICETIGIGWLAWIIFIGYYAYYWSTTGQTLGLKSQNLRVVRVDGKPMTWETAAIRVVGYFVGSLCVLLGLLWVYWDPLRQGWHDKIAQTLVVRDSQ